MATSNLFPGTLPQLPSAHYGTSSGTSTAYTATAAAVAKLFSLTFNVASGNAPTLAVNGGTALMLVNSKGVAISPGEIVDGETRLVADAGGSYIVLGDANLENSIQPLTATVAANAMTIGLAATRLAFRSATLTTGVANIRSLTTALSLVIPNLASLGAVSAVAARIIVLVLDVSATVQELAVINLAGGVNLDETGVISTTILNTASTAANVVYSATARSNVPYRVVGFVDCTQATAGTYANAPSLVQGVGGQAMMGLSGFGYGQTWQNVAGSRVLGTAYYNTTGRPITVDITMGATGTGNAAVLQINGTTHVGAAAYTTTAATSVSGVVPPGGSYVASISGGGTINFWNELR